MLVLGHSAASFAVALFVNVRFGLGHQPIGHRQRDLAHRVQSGDKVDALDHPSLRMVVVPTDQFVFIGVGLFDNAVVNRDDTILTLHAAYRGLDHADTSLPAPVVVG